ncbi:MAG: succinylglutamate desuccinylase [Desulfobaccales bacterium]
MRSKLLVGLLVVVVAVFFVSSLATAQKLGSAKLLCVSKKELKGEETVASCMAKGERFAIVDPYGMVRILSPEEIELTKAFNPKAFETRAFGMRYQQLAPALPPMPSLTQEAP